MDEEKDPYLPDRDALYEDERVVGRKWMRALAELRESRQTEPRKETQGSTERKPVVVRVRGYHWAVALRELPVAVDSAVEPKEEDS